MWRVQNCIGADPGTGNEQDNASKRKKKRDVPLGYPKSTNAPLMLRRNARLFCHIVGLAPGRSICLREDVPSERLMRGSGRFVGKSEESKNTCEP